MKNKYKFLFGLKIAGGIILFTILFGFGVMYLWNWLVPELFQGPTINFWQAIGLFVLSKILFGGSGTGFKGRGRCGQRGHWRERMEERMKNMSPEERERMKSRCKTHFQSGQDEPANN